MSIKRITAIVPIQMLRTLESSLRECGVPGVTVERVQGYGEHPDYFRHDLMQNNARLVLYADDIKVERIVRAIAHCAHECGVNAGVLAVESIDRLVSLVDGQDVIASSLSE